MEYENLEFWNVEAVHVKTFVAHQGLVVHRKATFLIAFVTNPIGHFTRLENKYELERL